MKKKVLMIVSVFALILAMVPAMSFADELSVYQLDKLYSGSVDPASGPEVASYVSYNYNTGKAMDLMIYFDNKSDNALYVGLQDESQPGSDYPEKMVKVEPGTDASIEGQCGTAPFYLCVVNEGSSAANFDYFVTQALKKPAKPNVKAGKKGTLNVSWKAVSGADKYNVYYKVGSKEYKTTVKKTTKVTLKKLKSGKKYKVRIQAGKSISGMYVDSDPSAYSKTVKVK